MLPMFRLITAAAAAAALLCAAAPAAAAADTTKDGRVTFLSQPLRESKLNKLVEYPKGMSKLEASGVVSIVRHNQLALLVAFDSSPMIAVINSDLLATADNAMLGVDTGKDEGYEGLACPNRPWLPEFALTSEMAAVGANQCFAVIEVAGKKNTGTVVQYALDGHILDTSDASAREAAMKIVTTIPTNTNFEKDNSGFEGLALVPRTGGVSQTPATLLGLCEGNKCEKKYKDHGQYFDPKVKSKDAAVIHVLQVGQTKKDNTKWDTVFTFGLPDGVGFGDYSGIDLMVTDQPDVYRVGVVSQESSMLFVGMLHLDLAGKTAVWKDAAAKPLVYQFPPFSRDSWLIRTVRTLFGKKDKKGKGKKDKDDDDDDDDDKAPAMPVQYCNVEGFTWIDATTFAIVSDKAKSDQPDVCSLKDQSVSIFKLE
jgi:hypothetical protein